MKKRWIWIAPLAILAFPLFIWLGGEIVMRLWNWLLPSLFGFHQITFWQGIGLLTLCRILFGGLSSHGGSRSRMRGKMSDRWDGMPPEEREKFREAMRARCGFGAPSGESKPSAG